MDTFGKTAWMILLAGCALLPCVGCAEKPAGQFETYGSLKKSAPENPADTETAKTADATPQSTAKTPAETKTPASPKPNLTQANLTQANPTPAVAQSPAVPNSTKVSATAPAANPSNGSNVTVAGFQASVSSNVPKTRLGQPGKQSSASGSARKVQLLVPNRTFKPEGSEEAWRVSYDDLDLLKVLNMDPVPANAVTMMPAWLKGLEGRRVRIRGFMYPTFTQTGIHAFGLARDNQICCFGRNPKIYDVFDVRMRDGVTTDYLPNRPFDVVGVFHIRPDAEDGKLFHLYEMDDATVIAK